MLKGRTSWIFWISLTAFIFLCTTIPFTRPSRSQEQNPAPSQAASQQAPADASTSANQRKKTKKVWTNEDMGAVKDSPVSQVGKTEPAMPSSNPPPSHTTAVSPQLVATYRKQLVQLQAQQASVEKQIADLKDFQRGEPGHDPGMQLHKRYNLAPIDEQIRKLEVRHKQIADQIDTVLDAARKKGIESGQLH
jgi:hypothetical protein